MPKRAKKQSEHFSIPELKSRGWTKTLIERFLRKADATRPNPHYRRAAPMKLYLRQRVEAIEATEEFRSALEKAKLRQHAARKAVATKTTLTLKKAKELPVTVTWIPLERLVQRAAKHYETMYGERIKCEPWDKRDAFRDRICVNYLRHNATEYHENLEEIAGKVGKGEAYLVLWERIGKEIKAKYPVLAAEFDRQYQERIEVFELGSALKGRSGE